jgi:hypothetical protein
MTEEEEKRRPYTRVTPEIESRVLAAREILGPVSYTDIAERADLPERTVKYVLVELPRLRRIHSGEGKVEGSLRRRILNCITDVGMFKDVGDLRRALGMADDEHNVLHVLHALHAAGKVEFTERGNGMGTATVINIRLPKKTGKKNGIHPVEPVEPMPVISRQEYEQELSAKTKDIESEATAPLASAPGLDDAAYPLLTDLLERERKRTTDDPKALAYITAADALRGIDDAAADDLLEKALEFSVTYPSPLELEYVRYAEAHPEAARPDVQAREVRD